MKRFAFLVVLVAVLMLALSSVAMAHHPSTVTVCKRGVTLNVPVAKLSKYLARGATLGACVVVPPVVPPVVVSPVEPVAVLRAGYCMVVNGLLTFFDLEKGQPALDPRYATATPALVDRLGLFYTPGAEHCDPFKVS